MLIEIKVPQLSESVAEATLLAWHKKVGEAVKRDENLIDIETDKVVLELPAPADGVLAKIIKGDGGTVKAGEVIATLDTEGKAAVSAAAPAKPSAPAAKPAPVASAAPAMPAARKIAEEKGIDTGSIVGSGRGGRVTKGDVLGATSPPAPEAPAAVKPSLPQPSAPVSVEQILGNRPEQRVPMSRLRQRIAERLIQSQSTAAILTTFNEVNMGPVIELRNRYKERFEKDHGVKLGFMSFFVKASIEALKRFPVLNASVDGSDIIYHEYYDIGVAVSTDRGLIVPIVRDADAKSFAVIEKEVADYARKAREGSLAIEDLTGGTFTITNGGVFGSLMSTPIVNAPQSAILGMHAIKERAIVENGQVVAAPMMYIALSYDHRIIDGKDAVLFLVDIKNQLENPHRMLLGM